MKIMIDINVLLDGAQKREPHYRFSSIVISEVLKKIAAVRHRREAYD